MELNIRPAGQRGRFYPYSAGDIEKMFKKWNLIADENAMTFPHIIPEAMICPHAGYVYSGFTAHTAHRLMPRKNPERILIVGPSHYVYIEGMSIGIFDAYETPFGHIKVDREGVKFLTERHSFTFSERAHYSEHSTETQFPFVKYYNPGTTIIELIYGNVHEDELAEVIRNYLQLPGSAVVISTDLSHYYPQEQANRLDAYCLEAVRHRDLYLLDKACEACGKTGISAILQTAKSSKWQAEITDYRTSGDVSGDFDAVVGYMSAVFFG